MNRLLFNSEESKINPREYSPLALAFLGDAVFELMARELLVGQANRPAGDLHRRTAAVVCAGAQSDAVQKLTALLSDEERSVYNRGRNAHVNNIPKGCTDRQYHQATGLEALFGYLYLQGNIERLRELFLAVCK